MHAIGHFSIFILGSIGIGGFTCECDSRIKGDFVCVVFNQFSRVKFVSKVAKE